MSCFAFDFFISINHCCTNKDQIGLAVVDNISYIFGRREKIDWYCNTIILNCRIKCSNPSWTIFGINGNFRVSFLIKNIGKLLNLL